jgi:hypothetical protein
MGVYKKWGWVKKRRFDSTESYISPSPSLPISPSALQHLQQSLTAEGEKGRKGEGEKGRKEERKKRFRNLMYI